MKRKAETSEGKKKKETIDIRAIKKSVYSVMKDRGDLIVAVDDTFGTALVYAYGTFDEFNALRERLFNDTKRMPEAHGYCVNGVVSSVPCACSLAWVNSMSSKDRVIPWLMHEISHLVDFILEYANVSDKNGEAKAYLVERETKRALEELIGIRSDSTVTEKQITEVLE